MTDVVPDAKDTSVDNEVDAISFIATPTDSSRELTECEDFAGTFGASGKQSCQKLGNMKPSKKARRCEKSGRYKERCPLTCGE